MKAQIVLADFAQTDPAGKVHALGIGWTQTGTPTPPMALITTIEVGWNETNKKFELVIELVDADGHPVTASSPLGAQPIQFRGEVEMGRPPGVPAGTPIVSTVANQIPPGLQLEAGQRYEWRVSLGGKSHADWCASFLVR